MGEFEGESGGSPTRVIYHQRTVALTDVRVGGVKRNNNRDLPLEMIVEAEPSGAGTPGRRKPEGWNSERLGYSFEARGQGASFVVKDYDGRALDWFDFQPQGIDAKVLSDIQSVPFETIPGMIGFPGAPEPRWWTIEDGAAYFDSAIDPEPNVLSMLLPEFFYTDIRNWFLVPAPMEAGQIRHIDSVEVIDSFGVITALDPVPTDQTQLFTLGGETLGNDTMLIPNVAVQVVDCDTLEEVTWSRDEAANLVWAHERLIQDPMTGVPFETGTEVAPDTLRTDEEGDFYTLKNDLPRAYIPYVPRQTSDVPAIEGDIGLRRGRTQVDATLDAPQHRSTFVAETTWLHHETIPPDGLKTRRLHRYARGSDGEPYFWIGRDRNAALKPDRVTLRFDYIRKEKGS
ncbi:hypothetical protein [Roseivivax sp. CAU 1753]